MRTHQVPVDGYKLVAYYPPGAKPPSKGEDPNTWHEKHDKRRSALLKVRADPPIYDNDGDACKSQRCQDSGKKCRSEMGMKASSVTTLEGWDRETGTVLPPVFCPPGRSFSRSPTSKEPQRASWGRQPPRVSSLMPLPITRTVTEFTSSRLAPTRWSTLETRCSRSSEPISRRAHEVATRLRVAAALDDALASERGANACTTRILWKIAELALPAHGTPECTLDRLFCPPHHAPPSRGNRERGLEAMKQYLFKIMRKGDAVLAILPGQVAIRRKNGEVDVYPFFVDQDGTPRLDLKNRLTITFGDNTIEIVSTSKSAPSAESGGKAKAKKKNDTDDGEIVSGTF